MNWRCCTIGDFVDSGEAEIQTGPFGTQLKASDYTSAGTPVINVRNIGYGGIKADKLEYVAESTRERLATHILERGDIVFGRKGAVDRHLLVNDEIAGAMQGSDCIRIRFANGAVSPRFLSFAFLTEHHRRWMLAQSGSKATMASLNHDIIRRIPLRLPVRDRQDRIAEALFCYDALIANNRRRMELLEELARRLYEEWFVRLRFPGHQHTRLIDGLPEGWKQTAVPEVVEINPPTPLTDAAEHTWVEMADLPLQSMVVQNWTQREGRSGSKFQNGDTLFARITPCLENGKTAFVNFLADAEVARGSTEFIVLRATKTLSPEFVYCLARTYAFRENAIKSMVGSSGRQRVQESCFEKFMVLVPPNSMLQQFSAFVVPVFRQVRILHTENERLRSARDLLLPRLMSGEIEV